MHDGMLRRKNAEVYNAVKEKVSICGVVLTCNDFFRLISNYSDFCSKYPVLCWYGVLIYLFKFENITDYILYCIYTQLLITSGIDNA